MEVNMLLSTQQPGNATDEPPPLTYYDVIARYLSIIYPFLFAAIGTIGNGLALIVLSRRRMRKSSTGIFLIALAIADTFVLYSSVISAVNESILLYPSTNVWVCRLDTWLYSASRQTSAWLIVTVLCERLIALSWPSKILTIMSSTRAKIISVSWAVVFLSFNFHYWWTMAIDDEGCHLDYEKFAFLEAFGWINISLYSLLPSAILIATSVVIIYKVHTQTKQEDRPIHETLTQDETSILTVREEQEKKNRRQMTVLLLAVSIGFLICTLPTSICFALDSINICPPPESLDPQHLWDLLINEGIGDGLIYINHSCNVFIYMLAWQYFRKELMRVICCFRKASWDAHDSHQMDSGTIDDFSQTEIRF